MQSKDNHTTISIHKFLATIQLQSMTNAHCESGRLWRKSFQWIIPAPREDVWAITGDFVRIDKWAPSLVAKSVLAEGIAQQPGCLRYVEGHKDPSLGGSANLYAFERLLEMDADNYRYKYRVEAMCSRILQEVFVEYTSTVQLVRGEGNCTRLLWSYEVSPAAGIAETLHNVVVQWLYETAVADLKKQLLLP